MFCPSCGAKVNADTDAQCPSCRFDLAAYRTRTDVPQTPLGKSALPESIESIIAAPPPAETTEVFLKSNDTSAAAPDQPVTAPDYPRPETPGIATIDPLKQQAIYQHAAPAAGAETSTEAAAPTLPREPEPTIHLADLPKTALPPRHASASAPTPPPAPGGKKRILIIEDDPFISELYQLQLTGGGYLVEVATDGNSGSEMLAENHYDLLLLDVMLPHRNGLNILKSIKEEHVLPDLPVVILSNLDQGSVIDRGLELGALHYLVKANNTPKDLQTLVESIVPPTA
jgi:CheY-like chemotaxis protein